MSPLEREANAVRSLRAWESEIPALVARSENLMQSARVAK